MGPLTLGQSAISLFTSCMSALLHAAFFRHVVAEDDETFLLAGGDGIAGVFDGVPFAGFAAYQDVNAGSGETANHLI